MPKKRFVLFEDNEDGTTTMTACVDESGEEHVFVVGMSFEDLSESLAPATMDDAQALMNENAVYIPPTPPMEGD